MATDHANIAAAITAGFKEIVTDRGATATPRYRVTLEKQLTGGTGQSGGMLRAEGEGASQAAAETQALAALNAQRNYRYGADAAGGSKDSQGNALTVDVK